MGLAGKGLNFEIGLSLVLKGEDGKVDKGKHEVRFVPNAETRR
jgi:hypothetical protein